MKTFKIVNNSNNFNGKRKQYKLEDGKENS
jgi:hypothetical protein